MTGSEHITHAACDHSHMCHSCDPAGHVYCLHVQTDCLERFGLLCVTDSLPANNDLDRAVPLALWCCRAWRRLAASRLPGSRHSAAAMSASQACVRTSKVAADCSPHVAHDTALYMHAQLGMHLVSVAHCQAQHRLSSTQQAVRQAPGTGAAASTPWLVSGGLWRWEPRLPGPQCRG